jgi:hypothetical protein
MQSLTPFGKLAKSPVGGGGKNEERDFENSHYSPLLGYIESISI